MKHARARSAIVATMMTLSLSGPGAAQDAPPRNTRPSARIPVPHIGGNGHTVTWDGRVFIYTQGYNGPVGWLTRVLRPENIGTDGAGLPEFGGSSFSDIVPLELDGAPNTGMTDHNALAVIPMPGVHPNPFRSDADGNRQDGGAYETYELLLYTQYYRANDDRMGQRRARIVVREPRTGNAAVAKAEMLSAFEELRTVDGQPLRGLEPTVTFDGHLFVWQGHPLNDGQIDVMMYSYNQTAGAVGGWSKPRSIADMYHVDRDVMVAGVKFDERFPMAQQPLRAADGQVYDRGDLYIGAYPWISHDGSELVHAATVAGTDGVDRARRGGLSIIGRLTNFSMWHIDNPLNHTRDGKNGTLRLFFSSPGLTPGIWTPFRGERQPLPYTGGRPVYPLFGSNSSDYGEVSFEDADGDHVLVLHLNELIKKGGDFDLARTPDTSGQHQVARLEGAKFPNEYAGVDEQHGAIGQALYFTDTAAVRVQRPQGLAGLRDALTVETWVKRLVDLDQDGENRYRLLLNKPGTFDLILEENGALQAGVTVNGQLRRSGGVGMVPMNRWTHVAFTYDAGSGALRVFVDGALAGERAFGAAPLGSSQNDLIVGPGGQLPSAPFVGAGTAVLMLDEVRVSKIVRPNEDILRSACRAPSRQDFSGRLHVGLPRGIDARDLRVPAGQDTSAERAELGKLLFFDPRLSKDGSISCSTCHHPSRGFADGFDRARGLGGKVLDRNTPTVINRALSTRQFWDGRAGSVEEQAIMPIEHPDEMGLGIDEAVRFLDAADDYRRAFERAYGSRPTAALVGRALADFQRTLLSGDSRADRYAAGDRMALAPQEERGRELFFGKARCAACHVGSNLSDESFHDTAQTSGSDAGRAAATGRSSDRRRMKTPTLRDISQTGPYLHDGSVGTLEGVLELYDRGGVRRDGRDVEVRPLGLSAGERAELVAFLRALDGTTVNVSPPSLPPGPGGSAPPAPGAPGMPAPTPPPAPTPTPPPAPTPTPTPTPMPTPTPPAPPPPAPAPPPPAAASDNLVPGESLGVGDSRSSASGRFVLVYQGDGNLVLYEGGTALWASYTQGAGSVSMQGDGNLVAYDAAGRATWSSGTAGNPGAWLAVQGDGNVVVYSARGAPLWSTGTAR